jgi:hypothetical protein
MAYSSTGTISLILVLQAFDPLLQFIVELEKHLHDI